MKIRWQYPAQGRQICDGEELIHTILDTARLAVKDSGVDPEEIASLSCDCFRCTIALRDKDGVLRCRSSSGRTCEARR